MSVVSVIALKWASGTKTAHSAAALHERDLTSAGHQTRDEDTDLGGRRNLICGEPAAQRGRGPARSVKEGSDMKLSARVKELEDEHDLALQRIAEYEEAMLTVVRTTAKYRRAAAVDGHIVPVLRKGSGSLKLKPHSGPRLRLGPTRVT